MTEHKHTPGPWTIQEDGETNTYHLMAGDRWLVAFLQNGEMLTDRQRANARLIEAAPDMLEALEMAVHALKAIYDHPKNPWRGQQGDGIPVHVFCQEAIRKATGGAVARSVGARSDKDPDT